MSTSTVQVLSASVRRIWSQVAALARADGRPVYIAGALIGLFVLTACGQDTPLTRDNSAPVRSLPAATPSPAPQETHAGPGLTGTSAVTPDPTPSLAPMSPRPVTNAQLPACAPAVETPVAVPADFAPHFPLPPGMKLSQANMLKAPYVHRVIGYAPLSLQDSIRYIVEEFPKAGYAAGRSDEEPGEAELGFAGNGWNGSFQVLALQDCPDATMWIVIALKHK